MDRLIATLKNTADGALLRSEDGKVVFWNHAAERLLGFRADEVLGRYCHEVMCGKTLAGEPLCSASCAIADRVTRGDPVPNSDVQTHTKGGRMVWLNVSSLSVPSWKKGRFLVAHLFRDISKQAKVHQLEDKLHAALRGVLATASAIQAGSPDDSSREIPMALPLSKREREVLGLLAAGKDTEGIADSLCISPTTVRNHIQHILEKLGAHNRPQALAIAFHPGQRSS